MHRYFYCYSYNLKEFLKSKGLRFVVKSINEKNGKKFWLFEGCEELQSYLIEWSDNKK